LPDLAAFFGRHDLQIGAGGGAVWERCCIGVPTIACVTAPNQLSTVPRLASLGALAWAREDDCSAQEAIATQGRLLLVDPALRLSLGDNAARLVDGQGSARVAAVLACAGGSGLKARSATSEDELLLLDWTNDPVVRANAFQSDAVLPQGHTAWFNASLADPGGCRIFILEAPNGIPVGQVRFERRDCVWEISYSVAAPFRGYGLAATVLRSALDAFPAGEAGVGVLGRVKLGNEASARVFRRLGFREARTCDERGEFFVFTHRHLDGDNQGQP
jgi:RimJ/RimL family protein N-acetyltransferase